jgi:hypothetical protein
MELRFTDKITLARVGSPALSSPALICLVLMFIWLALPIKAQASSSAPQPRTTPPPLVVLYKIPQLASSEHSTFEIEILKLALDKTIAEFGPYQLEGVSLINPARTLVLLNEDAYPNLIIHLSYEDEIATRENIIFSPFPIYRGASAYRLCFVRDELKNQIKGVINKEQLKPYHFGVGIGWIETKIFRHNGLDPVEGNGILSLFRMTKAGRVDFFCRSVMEYAEELDHPSSLGLSSAPNFALYHPLPKFLFAHKNSKPALDRIHRGLNIAFQDGSFEQLWRRYHLAAFEKAHLKERRLIRLENPFIEHLPSDYETYLFDPISYQYDSH